MVMNTSSFWRKTAMALILANLLFALWSVGFFGFIGLNPGPVREPQRLDEQISPEAVQIQRPQAARPAQATPAPASAASD
jgi:hypothetical protein